MFSTNRLTRQTQTDMDDFTKDLDFTPIIIQDEDDDKPPNDDVSADLANRDNNKIDFSFLDATINKDNVASAYLDTSIDISTGRRSSGELPSTFAFLKTRDFNKIYLRG